LKATEKHKEPCYEQHSLLHIVNFAAGIQNNSSTAIDNIFVENSRINLSSLSPILNGLSDHDA
jgi:hypothetical protein